VRIKVTDSIIRVRVGEINLKAGVIIRIKRGLGSLKIRLL